MTPHTRRSLLHAGGGLLAGGLLAGCLDASIIDGSGAGPELLISDLERERDPDVDKVVLREVVRSNIDFGFDLHRQLVKQSLDENLLTSPYSISVALAMTWVGARDETEMQMADAMHYTVGQDRLHPAFNAIDQMVDRQANPSSSDETKEDDTPFRLSTVNAIWGLPSYPYRDTYLDTLAVNYGAGLHLVDFRTEPEEARTQINHWIADRTEDEIEELLPSDTINSLTRLVLTNAIYFRANWLHTFSEGETSDETFTALDGTTSTMSMMYQRESFPYAEADGHQLIELPYVGERVGMIVILPKEGTFERAERLLDAKYLADLLSALELRDGEIFLPRFTYASAISLKDVLSALGMPSAFDSGRANFGGMADLNEAGENLFIDDVVHKTHIAVDEHGTEAAAATAVGPGAGATPPENPFEMTVNRPFVFLIRDRETESVLFLGRVIDMGDTR